MLKQRILTALVLLPLMIGMLFFADAQWWASFAGLMALVALWEYARICHMKAWQNALYLGVSLALGIYLYQTDFRLQPWQHALVLLFWLVVVPLWLKFKWRLQANVFGYLVGWLLMGPFWLALISLRPNSAAAGYLLAIMGMVWIADVAAYFVGRSIGKRKLAPTISPNKSWEGAIGGVMCVCVYAVVLQQQQWFAVNLPLLQTLVIAVVLTAVSVCGDLLESWLKRAAGVKDSSQLLPGHGGVFDRVDSLIAVLSVYAALLSWLTFKVVSV
ncbi:phosphatidate cytidylyltransferase [Snodgrassella sp. CFCC 13594]|uniref:phosphatidate cytidylyltransferase n=1 Tax=Snodgrassella sp. CFCC 13594 TaxID=1775559 RepID=UPI0008346341|nr:phosphatidate cytidylyltransferase [Snodgrassella sp. CFCC 13594]